ncbi:DnaJ domain-containing protein [Paraburkholderia humisilvae]|uniref:DnaJ domain-containing protein n=1 Tax=Paraburkholderia humisilvae TaxID=627669 RepID=UPI001581E9A5
MPRVREAQPNPYDARFAGLDRQGMARSYRQLARELHPDRNFDDSQTTERFQLMLEAYQRGVARF